MVAVSGYFFISSVQVESQLSAQAQYYVTTSLLTHGITGSHYRHLLTSLPAASRIIIISVKELRFIKIDLEDSYHQLYYLAIWRCPTN